MRSDTISIRLLGNLALAVFAFLALESTATGQDNGQLRLQSIDRSRPGLLTLHWTGGEGPFGIERIDPLPLGVWRRERTTTWKTASVPLEEGSAFYRIHDL